MATFSEAMLRRTGRLYARYSCEKCGSTDELRPYYRDGDVKNLSPRNIGALCLRCYPNRYSISGTPRKRSV